MLARKETRTKVRSSEALAFDRCVFRRILGTFSLVRFCVTDFAASCPEPLAHMLEEKQYGENEIEGSGCDSERYTSITAALYQLPTPF